MQTAAKHPSFDVMGLFRQEPKGWSVSTYPKDQIVYAQGDPANSVFYIHQGKVKVTVVSKRGKEAVVAIRGPDEFCGEGARRADRNDPGSRECIHEQVSKAGPDQLQRQA